jgi:DNA polymerase elongation subunit (family B)
MLSKLELVNAYQSGSELVLLSRDASGRLVRKTERPEYVIYLDATDVGEDFGRQLSKSRFVKSFKREGKWLRVGWADRFIRDDMIFGRKGNDPRPSPFAERGITVYEGDVSPVRRFIADHDVTIQKPKRAFFDLETDSRVPFSRKEEMRILSWAFEGADGIKRSAVLKEDTHQAERDLLFEFFELASAYDQLLAWSGDGFDFPVLRARVEQRGLRVEFEQWLWLDQMLLFKKMNTASESGEEKQSMKLQSVAMALIGEGKDDFDASKTYDAWAAGGKHRERMVRYNEKDTALLPKIEKKTGSAAVFDAIADVTNTFPETRSLQTTVQMDGYMLRKGLLSGMHFPTRRFRDNVMSEQYEGAYVMKPKAHGVERDVHVADFASLYPFIILTWNMSPETKVNGPVNGPIPEGMCRAPSRTRQCFTTGTKGILCEALTEVLEYRKVYNTAKANATPGTTEWFDADRRSTAYKTVANSFYGGIGSTFSRFFDKQIAESVTLNGQWLIQRTIEEAEKRGMFALYADTDSLFVKNASRTEFEDFVAWCNKDFYPRIIAEQGCIENHTKLAYEKQFKRIVFCGAKKYAGVFAHYKGKEATADSKPEVKGLEYRRGDSLRMARNLQERAINKLIVDGENTPSAFSEMLGEVMQRVLHDELPIEEVQMSKAITKPLREYVTKQKKDGTDAAIPPHVRVAKILEARGQDVTEGTKISYVVLDGDGGINATIPAEDYTGDLDRYYLWESLVFPPTQRLLQAAFPDSDWRTNLESIRPKKVRKSRQSAQDQLGLAIQKPVAPGEQEFTFGVLEAHGAPALVRLQEVCTRHPGGKPLVVHLCLASGVVAVVATEMKVSGSPALLLELDALRFELAASHDWETRCAS